MFHILTWDILNIVGIVAFAISGAIIAIQEKYDILGVYVLGFVTAFGGGAVRNVLLGIPVSVLWEQQFLFIIALFVITFFFFFPYRFLKHWGKWGHLFDAIGLSAFAIQGALFATKMGHPLSAIIVAATLTGTGGGMIRDVLAGRKPLVFRDEIYAVWAALAGVFIGIGIVHAENVWSLYALFVCIVLLRMLSVTYKWRLPRRDDFETLTRKE